MTELMPDSLVQKGWTEPAATATDTATATAPWPLCKHSSAGPRLGLERTGRERGTLSLF